MWETLPNSADWYSFQDPDLAGDLEDSWSTSGGFLCIFGSRTFVPVRWMCKKHTAITQFHRGTCNILRRWLSHGRFSALDLWNLVIEVLHSPSPSSLSAGASRCIAIAVLDTCRNTNEAEISRPEKSCLGEIDYLAPKAKTFFDNALGIHLEDHAAVIKVIIDGRSPTMRHVSRTHRVALDWLFDRINLDPEI